MALPSATLLVSDFAHSQSSNALERCADTENRYSLDAQIEGCTEFLQSGKLSKAEIFLAFYVRGHVHEKKGDLERALADYSEAIRIDARHAEPYWSRGELYFRQGDLERALRDLNEAIRIAPNHAAAFRVRGLVYDKRKQSDRAIADLRRAAELGNLEAKDDLRKLGVSP